MDQVVGCHKWLNLWWKWNHQVITIHVHMLKTRSLQHHWGSKFQWLTGPSSWWVLAFPVMAERFSGRKFRAKCCLFDLFICSFGVWNWWRKTFYRYSFEMFADREVGITNTGNAKKFFRFMIASLLLFVCSRNFQSASLASFWRAASHTAR